MMTARGEKVPDVQLIINKDDRLEQFKEMFESYVTRGACKKHGSTYIFATDQMIPNPHTMQHHAFNMLQQDAMQKGFITNCFCFGIK